MPDQGTIAIFVFMIVIVSILWGKIHRTAVAAGGAVLLFLTGVLSVETGVAYIDFNTIGLLTGMMLFVAVVKRSGIFEAAAVGVARITGGDPWYIMVCFALLTALLSALLDNVTTVLLMGPVTLAVAKSLRVDPIPFFMTQIFASNIGGTATLIGDPPNIMIGSAAGFSFSDFLRCNGPVILVILLVTIFCFRMIYGRRMNVEPAAVDALLSRAGMSMIRDKRLLGKSLIVMALVVFGFLLHRSVGVESSVVALAGAAVMMIIGGQDLEKVISDVEWSTILFFIGLFLVVGGLVETGVIGELAKGLAVAAEGREMATMLLILWGSALLSSTLDNIPFVATMVPLLLAMESQGAEAEPFWWALSLGACLGGNGTLIGASANVVLAGISEKNGHPITYLQFLKVGFPLMLLSIVISSVYLLMRYGSVV